MRRLTCTVRVHGQALRHPCARAVFADEVFVFSEHLNARSERHAKLVDQLNDAAGPIVRIAHACERSLRDEANPLIQEPSELVAIITTIVRNAKSNPDRRKNDE